MQKPPTVYVLSEDDVRRVELMIVEMERALNTLFERRLVEPMSCPDDLGNFDAVADKVHKDYLF